MFGDVRQSAGFALPRPAGKRIDHLQHGLALLGRELFELLELAKQAKVLRTWPARALRIVLPAEQHIGRDIERISKLDEQLGSGRTPFGS
jgi:hypothetical protein